MIGATFVKEIQLLLRDRGALISTFLLPVIFITLFGLAFRGMDSGDENGKTEAVPFAVWHEKDHAEAEALVKLIEEGGFLDVRRLDRPEAVRDRVADEKAQGGLIIPRDYAPGTRPAELVIDEALQPFERMAIEGPLQGAFSSRHWGRMFPGGRIESPTFYVAASPPGLKKPLDDIDSFQVSVPGNAVLFNFFLALGVALSFYEERKSGTWRRLLAAPGSRASVLFGKLLPFCVVGFIQMALLFAFGALIFGMRIGGSVAALALITVCVVFVAVALGLLIASFGGSEKQISNYASIVILAMGLVGGCMLPRLFMPAGMKSAGLAIPHGWAMDAYYDVLIREGTGIPDVALPCLVLLGFGIGFATLGLLRFRFE